jgi:two-component system, NtrC family, response regulator AtoC
MVDFQPLGGAMPPPVEDNASTGGIVTISVDAVPFVRGVSPAMRSLERVIADVAPTDVPILLVGESGTGKDAVALEVHRRSSNSNDRFVKCNCATLVADTLRAHLGNGASAGREFRRKSGTTFFDDISGLNAANQNVLLQFLSDDRSAPNEYCLRDRVISSTTHNLEREMRAARFREELYYRINGVCLRLPALSQRLEDLPLLLDHFLKKYASSFEHPQPQLSPTTMEFLHNYPWPGNVHELENFARRLVILGSEELALADLVSNSSSNVLESRRGPTLDNHKSRSLKAAARQASHSVEREMILNSLERTHWNRKRTARELQISYKALLYKVKQLNIDGGPRASAGVCSNDSLEGRGSACTTNSSD